VNRRATPLRTTALVKAAIVDEHFVSLPAKAQRALLVVIVLHADHDGCFELKHETLAAEIGCERRNAWAAMSELVPSFLEQTDQRRSDGSRRASAYRLVDRVLTQADDFVRLWTTKATKTSSGSSSDEIVTLPSSDEIVTLPSSDEIVTARTVLNGSLNGFGSDEPEEKLSTAEVQAMLRENGLLREVPS
jgi:hypothetical protein